MSEKISRLLPTIIICSSLLVSCSNGDKEVSSTNEKVSIQKEINQAEKYISNKEYSKVEDLKSQIYEKDGKIDSKD
ncbi:hypothetical protein ACLHDF_18990 [Priestia aryabhattai]|uniref:hypothetical protein n=1 Tax=Priestia megaterium TaxID=1404 RepID=UPI0039B8957B